MPKFSNDETLKENDTSGDTILRLLRSDFRGYQ
jgi:hypothetical protein